MLTGEQLVERVSDPGLSSLDALILRNVAGKLGLPPFYPGQPDQETLVISAAALEAVGSDGVIAAAATLLSHIMDLYEKSAVAPHRMLSATPLETSAIVALYQRHMTIAQPLFLATRYLLAKQYESFPFTEAALELGIGSGDTAKAILGDRTLSVGSTPVIDEIMGSRHHYGNHRHYMAIDASLIPFDDETFNTVTMNYTFYHLEHPAKACQEIYRVLQPGGCFAFNFLKRDTVTATRVLPNMLAELGLADHAERADRFVFVDYGADGVNLDLEQALSFVSEAGFSDIRSVPFISQQLSKLMWLVRDYEIVLGLSAIQGVHVTVIEERYRRFCANVIAPLLANDEALSVSSGGTFAFVTARKPGQPSPSLSDAEVFARLRCPVTKSRLLHRGTYLDGGETAYPVLRGVPLTIPVYSQIWAAQQPGVPPSERSEFQYL